MNTLGSRIDKVMLDKGIRNGQLASHCKVSASAVSQWRGGSTNDLKMSNLIAASELLEVNIEWLATGKGFENDNSLTPKQAINEDIILDCAKQVLAVLKSEKIDHLTVEQTVDLISSLYSVTKDQPPTKRDASLVVGATIRTLGPS